MRAARVAGLAAAVVAGGLMMGVGATRADGYPPFYGYSDYFGGPAADFTPETDVQQVTRPEGGYFGFGTRTYYRGGPFWAYKATRVARASTVRKGRRSSRRIVVHSKG